MKDIEANTCNGREKYWSELGVEEKIERLRQQVKSLRSSEERLDRIVEMLKWHQHSPTNGHVLVEIKDQISIHGHGSSRGLPPNDDVYI